MVVLISELAKRSDKLGGLIAALPLITILPLIWLHVEKQAEAKVARIAGAHHERLDGGGYPRGLKAEDINIETRIITTADILDAITAERPYRGAIPIPEALNMMEQTVGTALIPPVLMHSNGRLPVCLMVSSFN